MRLSLDSTMLPGSTGGGLDDVAETVRLLKMRDLFLVREVRKLDSLLALRFRMLMKGMLHAKNGDSM